LDAVAAGVFKVAVGAGLDEAAGDFEEAAGAFDDGAGDLEVGFDVVVEVGFLVVGVLDLLPASKL